MCTERDYHEIEGACKKGHQVTDIPNVPFFPLVRVLLFRPKPSFPLISQETLYVWNEPKLCIRGVSLPANKMIVCEALDFWLKVGACVGAFTGVLLMALTCYFWKKNQK